MSGIQFIAPAALLRPFVATYWHLHADVPEGTVQSFIPGVSVAWIFNLRRSGTYDASGTRHDMPACFIKGPTTTASHVYLDRQTENYGIAFTSGAAAAFLRLPLAEIRDTLIDISAIGDRDLHALATRTRTASFAEATRLFDAFLLRRVNDAQDVHMGTLLLRSLPLGANTARPSGYSARHLRRLFLEKIGTSPKTVARIHRLRRAITALQQGNQSLTEIAASTGYFDQAHLNRDFRDMIGTSPSLYRSNLAPIARRFNNFSATERPDQVSC